MAPPIKVEISPVRVDDDDFLTIPTTLEGRSRPAIEPESRVFFDGLADGRVILQHCDDCDRFTHFPVGGCMWCGSAAMSYREVDGRATLNTFSVCYLSFGPGVEPPYVVGFVELDCQPGLQVMSNIVGLRISEIRIGMSLIPHFVHDGDLSILVYRPATENDS